MFCFNLYYDNHIWRSQKIFVVNSYPTFCLLRFSPKDTLQKCNKTNWSLRMDVLNSLHTWLFEVTSYSHQVVHKKFSEECVFSPRCPRRNWRVPYRCRRAVPSRAVEPVSPCGAVPCGRARVLLCPVDGRARVPCGRTRVLCPVEEPCAVRCQVV